MIDVVIPVYKPGESLERLLRGLSKQNTPIHRILLINTEKRYFDEARYRKIADFEVEHISAQEFDHAATRNRGIRSCKDADYVLFMTQDAIPADEHLIEHLLTGMQAKGPRGERVAVSYARQLPKKGCSAKERYMRNFSYPNESRIKTRADEKTLGIKTYFCSDVCALYDRSIYESLGGFVNRAIFNEDMLYAYAAIAHGYAVHYVAEAKVVHSHDYDCRQQFTRHFDMGVSQAQHPEVFTRVSSESEGVAMTLATAGYLYRNGAGTEIPYMLGNNAARYAGYLLGKHYRLLDREICKYLSANKEYWK